MSIPRSLPDSSVDQPAGVQFLVTAHNGPQVTIHYKRAEFLGCLQAVLSQKLNAIWSAPEPEESYALRSAVEGGSSQLVANRDNERQGGGLRGEIKGLSRQSRGRLMHDLASINRAHYDPRRVLFMTLTYHLNWPEDAAEQYSQLRRWFKRMNRRWPGLVVKWRKEWQGRLAPHFHLIAFTPDDAIPGEWWPFIDDALEQWVSIVKAPGDSLRHMMMHSVDARMMASWGGVVAYASKTEKYISKAEKLLPADDQGEVLPTGRLWGTLGNKNNLPVDFEHQNISRDEFMRVRRVYRRLLRPADRVVPKFVRSRITSQKVLMSYSTSLRLLGWLGYYAQAPPDDGPPVVPTSRLDVKERCVVAATAGPTTLDLPCTSRPSTAAEGGDYD